MGKIPIEEIFIFQRNSKGETQDWKSRSSYSCNDFLCIIIFAFKNKYPLITKRNVANLECFKL